MGFLSARETADKLLEAGFPVDLKSVLNEKIRENMDRILVEGENYEPVIEEVNGILAVGNWDREIGIQQFTRDGILVKEFSVTIYSLYTSAKGTFVFDNYCAADNDANLAALKKWVEEN